MTRKKCPHCGRFFDVSIKRVVEDGEEIDSMNALFVIEPLGKKTGRAGL